MHSKHGAWQSKRRDWASVYPWFRPEPDEIEAGDASPIVTQGHAVTRMAIFISTQG